ncbi:helix-turn-helix domain-containing protein [Paenibacillus illinoisensis]|uniref:helix-turn-helix domain-containing protein n=1 Tax=Paenibacillus illinoisensis TaxID=59845 RepID=UPI001C8D82FD|nr:helix-turn-helix domain-containing protein [Paenibacillus illinoisensis]MBY0218555.1 helix-turn-helix transcriptional regulator [Paenibacillus illinoisensis]
MERERLREDRIHGNPMYPVSVYPDIEQLNGDSILDCHWHDEMEFTMVTQGSAVFQIDMNTVEVKAGEAIFVNRGEIHAGYLKSDLPCVFSSIVFSPELLGSRTFDAVQEKFIRPLVHKTLIPPFHMKPEDDWGREILLYLQRIFADHANGSETCEMTTKAYLYLIFARMFEHMRHAAVKGTVPTGSHDKVERLKSVLGYIHKRYPEQLKLKELADEANMSEGHFCRFFKQMVQKSPVDYINYYRVQQACYQLENTDHKIVDIAMDVGFEHLSYFITTFKKHKNTTPSQYRKMFYEKVAMEPALI